MPDAKTVDRAVAIIQKGRTNRIYFFDKLDDPAWIEPLKERGFFSKPPDPIEREGGVMLPAWPESEYLVRMAERAPELVAQVLDDIPETENVRVRGDMLRAAAKVGRGDAVRVARREQAWIEKHSHLWFDYPEAVAALILHLADVGAGEDALDLARTVLDVVPTGDTTGWRRATATRFEQWTYGQLLNTTIPRLAEILGLPALTLIADLLQTALELDPQNDKPIDLSDIWRPAIEDHAQNVGIDFRDDLVRTLRDVALSWTDGDGDRVAAMVRLLLEREWIIFRRLALYLLAEKVETTPEQAVDAALDPANFFEERALHEFMELSQRVFGVLSETQRTAWLALLDKGPSWPSREATKRAEDGVSDEQYERYVAIWRRDRLQVLDEQLPIEQWNDLAELITSYGRNEHPTFHSYFSSWVGPTAPLGEAELEAMTPVEAVAFIRSWEPSGDPASPSAEGLGRLLSARVVSDPTGFSALAADGQLDDLDPTYVRAILGGLAEVVKADRGAEVDWGGALNLAELSGRAPETGRPQPAPRDDGRDWDPGWGWCRKAAASLLEKALPRRVVPPDFASRVWGVLSALSWDPEPTGQYERSYGGSNMDPLTLSINTVRGEAMHAVVQYAVWRKLTAESESFGLDSLSDVADNLAAHLDASRDPSETTRAVFASRLGQLFWLDAGWLRDHLSSLFPTDDARLRLAAWETFLAWGRPSEELFELLREQYARAVRELPTPEDRRSRAGKDPGTAIAEHIGTYAWWGTLDLEAGGLFHEFVMNASVAELAHLVDFIGRSLDTRDDGADLASDVQSRLIRIWIHVSDWIAGRPPADRCEILAPFGWWYGSGRLDPGWADDQLLRLLSQGVAVDPDFRVGERLSTRATEDLRAALDVVRVYLSGGQATGWGLYSMRDAFRLTLSLALKSDDSKLAEDAEQILHEIGARGMLEFRDLLPRSGK